MEEKPLTNGHVEETNLCEECSKLDLSPDKFIIDDKKSKLTDARGGYVVPVRDSNELPKFRLNSKPSKLRLKRYGEIWKTRDSCPLCALIIRSVENLHSEAPKINSGDAGPACFLNWEIDGREAIHSDGRIRGRTRRIHIQWEEAKLKDAYLIFNLPDKFLRPNSESMWRDEALFLARKVDHTGGNRALIKSWLDLCLNTHSGPCLREGDRKDDFEKLISQSYFGVIDVQDWQLKPLEQEEEYVALSYVWGEGKQSHVTTLSNVLLHRNQAGLEKYAHTFPAVIMDAISLVGQLGYRYIWIDSLCIVQDSARSWTLNARDMDLIYGNAAFTICAADGDSKTGLKAMYPRTRDVYQAPKTCAPGVSLTVSRPPETSVKASMWNSRAWTFQERLLSRRCLIFTEGRVYFQCRSTGMSEDIYGDRKGAGWSLELMHAPLQMLRELDSRSIWVYMNCIELYTSRKLTFPKDILAAFQGMANLIGRKMQAPFVFGLPSSHLDLALLWEPNHSATRRKSENREDTIGFKFAEFPSWSWCGWMDARISYKHETIAGCLTNLQEWLSERTWIEWHIRDGRGRLRPLWHKTKAIRDRRTESRWQGYGMELSILPRNSKNTVTDAEVMPYKEYPGRNNRADYRDKSRTSTRSRSYRPSRSPTSTEVSDFDRLDLYDNHGRLTRSEVDDLPRSFNTVLPENPYRVVMEEYGSEASIELPDQPILQFWTWQMPLYVVKSENGGSGLPDGLCRYDIADEVGDWCGSLVADHDLTASEQPVEREFIAISEAKAFTDEECHVWTYYVPKDRDESEWDLFYVLLVEFKGDRRVWERVALGKVFKSAFSGSQWKEIALG